MKLRRVILIALCLVAVITVAACASTDSTTTKDTSSVTTPTAGGDGTSTPVTTTAVTTTVYVREYGNPSAIGATSNEASALPIINIKTDSGEPIVSRDEYITATVSAEGTANDEKFGFTSLTAEVRCRGNYTYTGTEKKSYRIKFTEKINLFGQGNGPAKSWVLLANHCDQSFLRNHVAFTLATKLSNISYSSSSSFVKLYVNGEYYGIYQVAEQHQVNTYRVNINEDPNVVDTDYLIERDSYADDDGYEGLNYFKVNWSTKYLVKSDFMTEEKCEFLRQYFQNAHDAISGGNKNEIIEYIDLDSFIDTFILQAMVKNTDIGYSSFFMVKKAGDKIYFTCPWDFDNSLGNDQRLDRGQPEGLYVGVKTDMYQQHEWFYLMMNNDWFCDMLVKRWNEVKADLYTVADEITRINTHFGDEIATNFEVWQIFGTRINQEPNAIVKLKTYSEHAEYLKNWFVQRYNYLDALFNSDEVYEQGGEENSWGGGGWWGGWGGRN